MIDMPWFGWDIKIRILNGILSFNSMQSHCGYKWERDDEPGRNSIDCETLS